MWKIDKDAVIEVYGVRFNGVSEIKEYAWQNIPKEGVYVGVSSERYPCFDSSDYAYEDRYYCNFVFARSKEKLVRKMEQLYQMKGDGIYRKFTDGLAPMIYWQGDIIHPMEITECEQVKIISEKG